jgi:2-polyprenyl-6-hydroxyphenyl methylase/3-demethylubiquinone-9 3-methyltransferase
MATSATTASPDELAKFEAMADSWWDPEGKFKPLHKFNPERIRYLRDTAAAHFGRDPLSTAPFQGLTLLDVGCGGGLLSEPLARLGFSVTGLDAADKNIQIARLHAARSGLPIDYRCQLVEDLARTDDRFDVVMTMEVVEHVDNLEIFLEAAATLVKPGGLLIGATLNRTLKALALAKIGAEYVLRWLPRGTHDWRRFLKPSEFANGLRAGGLEVTDLTGMSYNPLTDDWGLSDDLAVNYLLTAEKRP